MFKTNSYDLWHKDQQRMKIVTLCKNLDIALGGGIRRGIVTELNGGPGKGKTQMCLQLCITVQLPKEQGGLGGKALFLDTKQDFLPARLQEIAVEIQARFDKIFCELYKQASSQQVFTVNSILENVSYVYCGTYTKVLANVLLMRAMLEQQPELQLIVIDSFSFPMRQVTVNLERTRLIYKILTELQQLALDFNVAIVITNELTTKFGRKRRQIVPALSGSCAHKINQRIVFDKDKNSNNFVARIEKSVALNKVAVPFRIKQNGLSGVS